MLLKLGRFLSPGGGLTLPVLDYDFTTGTLPSGLTFTRASNAAYFNDSGVLQTASTNNARFDHSKSDNAPLGILIEESRTNNLKYARQLTHALWTKTDMSAGLTATGLDNTSNSASTLTASSANATTLQFVSLASAAYTFSVYIKRVSGSGTIEITDNAGVNYTDVTGSIDGSSDFVRVQITRTQSNPTIGIRLGTSGDSIAVDYAQLEAGSFATSPILTTGAAATRAADSLVFDSVSWYSSAQGTLWSETSFPYDGRATATIFNISNNSYGYRADLFNQGGNNPRGIVADTGVTSFLSSATPSQGPQPVDEVIRCALAYKVNDFAFALAGVIEDTDASGATASTITKAVLGAAHNGTAHWNGHIRKIRYYNKRLFNNQLKMITT